jgi:beta-lactamase regulating signal transducer with metallopeptidase domain
MSVTFFGLPLSLASAVDHLWQSTIVAVIALLVVLLLRRNRASLRYWIWFAASMKFLLPFALLMQAGQALRPAKAASARIVAFTETVDQIAQPFSQLRPSPPHVLTFADQLRAWLPYALLALWLAGFFAVVLYWWRRHRRILGALRAASPSTIQAEIPVLAAASSLEPGVFGLFRPVLLLPAGIA